MESSVTKLLQRRNGDVFIEVPRAEYCFVTGTIKNAGAGAVDISQEDMIGRPVKLTGAQWELAVAGVDEATVDGLVFDPQAGLALAAAAISKSAYVILIRGPAVVNLNQIVTGFTLATLATTLAALSPPIIRFTSASVTQDATS